MKKNKGIPVAIKLATQVIQNGAKEDFFFELEGQVIKMRDTLYIRYKETLVEGSEPIPVTVKIMPDGSVQLIRSQELRMRLTFIYRERVEGRYQTPYGTMQFETFTNDLRVSLKDQPISGTVAVDYDLHSGNEKIGSYQMRLDFSA